MVFKRGYVSSMSRKFSTRPRIKLTLTPKPFAVQTRDSGVYDESLVFDEKTLDHQVSIATVSDEQNPQTSNSHVSNKQTLETKIPQVYGSITQASTIRDQQTNSQVQLAQVIQVKPLISPKPRYSQKPDISPKPKVVKAFTDRILLIGEFFCPL